jgi:dihydrofolate reductase
MGRNTFEQVLSFDAWPYGDKRVIVLSSRPLDIQPHLPPTVSWSSQAPADLVRRLADEGARKLYVDGGVTIQRFLAAGLIDDMTITLIPVVLGGGRPLFGPLEQDIRLRLAASKIYDFGFVQLKYLVGRDT